MLTEEAKKYGLHPSDRAENMRTPRLKKLLRDLGIFPPASADRKMLLDMLNGATPREYLSSPQNPEIQGG